MSLGPPANNGGVGLDGTGGELPGPPLTGGGVLRRLGGGTVLWRLLHGATVHLAYFPDVTAGGGDPKSDNAFAAAWSVLLTPTGGLGSTPPVAAWTPDGESIVLYVAAPGGGVGAALIDIVGGGVTGLGGILLPRSSGGSGGGVGGSWVTAMVPVPRGVAVGTSGGWVGVVAVDAAGVGPVTSFPPADGGGGATSADGGWVLGGGGATPAAGRDGDGGSVVFGGSAVGSATGSVAGSVRSAAASLIRRAVASTVGGGGGGRRGVGPMGGPPGEMSPVRALLYLPAPRALLALSAAGVLAGWTADTLRDEGSGGGDRSERGVGGWVPAGRLGLGSPLGGRGGGVLTASPDGVGAYAAVGMPVDDHPMGEGNDEPVGGGMAAAGGAAAAIAAAGPSAGAGGSVVGPPSGRNGRLRVVTVRALAGVREPVTAMTGGVLPGGAEMLVLADATGGVEVIGLDLFGDVAGPCVPLWSAAAEEEAGRGVYALADTVDPLGELSAPRPGGDGRDDPDGAGQETPLAAVTARLLSPGRFSTAATARAVRAPAATGAAIAAALAGAGGGAEGVAALLARAVRAAADTDLPVVAVMALPSGTSSGGTGDGASPVAVGILRASGAVGVLRPALQAEVDALWGTPASPQMAAVTDGRMAGWPTGELAWRLAGTAAVQVAAAEVTARGRKKGQGGGAAALLGLGRGRAASDAGVPLTAVAASAALRGAVAEGEPVLAASLMDALRAVGVFLSPSVGGVLLWGLRRDWPALRLAAAAAAGEHRPAAALYGTAVAALGEAVALVAAAARRPALTTSSMDDDGDDESVDANDAYDGGRLGTADPVAQVALAFGALQQTVAVADGWDRAIAAHPGGPAAAPSRDAAAPAGPGTWELAAHPALTADEVADAELLVALSAAVPPLNVDDGDSNRDNGVGGACDGPTMTGGAGFWTRARSATVDAAKAAFFFAADALTRAAPDRPAHEAVRSTALTAALVAGSLPGALQALTALPWEGPGDDGEAAAAAALVDGVGRVVAAAATTPGGLASLAATPRLPAPVEVLVSRALAARARSGPAVTGERSQWGYETLVGWWLRRGDPAGAAAAAAEWGHRLEGGAEASAALLCLRAETAAAAAAATSSSTSVGGPSKGAAAAVPPAGEALRAWAAARTRAYTLAVAALRLLPPGGASRLLPPARFMHLPAGDVGDDGAAGRSSGPPGWGASRGGGDAADLPPPPPVVDIAWLDRRRLLAAAVAAALATPSCIAALAALPRSEAAGLLGASATGVGWALAAALPPAGSGPPPSPDAAVRGASLAAAWAAELPAGAALAGLVHVVRAVAAAAASPPPRPPSAAPRASWAVLRRVLTTAAAATAPAPYNWAGVALEAALAAAAPTPLPAAAAVPAWLADDAAWGVNRGAGAGCGEGGGAGAVAAPPGPRAFAASAGDRGGGVGDAPAVVRLLLATRRVGDAAGVLVAGLRDVAAGLEAGAALNGSGGAPNSSGLSGVWLPAAAIDATLDRLVAAQADLSAHAEEDEGAERAAVGLSKAERALRDGVDRVLVAAVRGGGGANVGP
ncbi:hypothetical protein MMPV_001141 [Pyropia vietnamensis]